MRMPSAATSIDRLRLHQARRRKIGRDQFIRQALLLALQPQHWVRFLVETRRQEKERRFIGQRRRRPIDAFAGGELFRRAAAHCHAPQMTPVDIADIRIEVNRFAIA